MVTPWSHRREKGQKKYIGIILPTDLALLVLSWGILNPS